MKRLLLITLTSLSACASIHPGTEGHAINDKVSIPLKLSAEFVENDGDTTYSMIVVTFENLSDHWLRTDGTEVLIPAEAVDSLSVVVGHDLVDWAEAKSEELKISEHNKQVAQLSLAAAGTATSAIAKGSSGNSNVASDIGDLMAFSGISYAVVDTINTSRRGAMNGKWVPEHHLYEKVSIPGKMFQRRWVLLNKKVGKIVQKLALRVRTIEGETNDYVVDIR